MGIVYKATNTITGEIYIGATTYTLQERKGDHLQKAAKKVGGFFQEAIGTYGPEAFSWEQIDTADSSEELAQKEIRYIAEYNSNEGGYNSSKGGEISKPVYRYNLDGSLDCKFYTLSEAGDSVGVRKQDISRACWSVNHILSGYLWSYEMFENFPESEDQRRRSVLQFELDGTLVGNYQSASEAAKVTGFSKTCITRCCRNERESSSGFIWSYI